MKLYTIFIIINIFINLVAINYFYHGLLKSGRTEEPFVFSDLFKINRFTQKTSKQLFVESLIIFITSLGPLWVAFRLWKNGL
jgi:hypothetical protein